jgi:hypothetical protein
MTDPDRHGLHTCSVGHDGRGAHCADSAAKVGLDRLRQLEPGVAAQLQAVWSDVLDSGRLIEQFLGGEKGERLETAALVELIGIYEYFEEARAARATDPDRPHG